MPGDGGTLLIVTALQYRSLPVNRVPTFSKCGAFLIALACQAIVLQGEPPDQSGQLYRGLLGHIISGRDI